MKTIYLCGFMGCGKTTAGKILAEKLSLPFTDMDDFIVSELDMTIPEIFDKYGEPYFRDMETKAVDTLGQKGGIISCGGGAMIRKQNAEHASLYGLIVFIDTNFYDCYNRIKNDSNRPVAESLKEDGLLKLYNERRPIYQSNCTFSVEGTGTPTETADKIMRYIAVIK